MRISDQWKQAIVRADPLDAVKVDFADAVLPPLSPGGVPAVPRVLRTAFVERWNADPAGAHAVADQLRDQVRTAAGEDRLDQLLPFTGQSAALVHDVAPAEALITRIMAEAEDALRGAHGWIRHPTA
jgi:enoyl-[acyl-carrier protein] reductase II